MKRILLFCKCSICLKIKSVSRLAVGRLFYVYNKV